MSYLPMPMISRRKLLQTAPLAAASFATAARTASASPSEPPAEPAPIQHITAAQMEAAVKQTQAAPGNAPLTDLPNTTIVVTTEVKKAGKEFEYHEHRDHIFQILEGETAYELGGTPQTPRNTKPGEWLAPGSEDAKRVELHKGDTLVIPRGTPHKRTTENSVTFVLISSQGA